MGTLLLLFCWSMYPTIGFGTPDEPVDKPENTEGLPIDGQPESVSIDNDEQGMVSRYRTQYWMDVKPSCEKGCECSKKGDSVVSLVIHDGGGVVVMDQGWGSSSRDCGERGGSDSSRWEYEWKGQVSMTERSLELALDIATSSCVQESFIYTRNKGGSSEDPCMVAPPEHLEIRCSPQNVLFGESRDTEGLMWRCEPSSRIDAVMSAFPWELGISHDMRVETRGEDKLDIIYHQIDKED